MDIYIILVMLLYLHIYSMLGGLFNPLWVVRVTHTWSHVQCSLASPLLRYSVHCLTPLGNTPFLFFADIFWGNPRLNHPHHAPTGPGFATLRESNLLSIVKPQYVVPYPHLKLYLVVWHGWVGSVTTRKLLQLYWNSITTFLLWQVWCGVTLPNKTGYYVYYSTKRLLINKRNYNIDKNDSCRNGIIQGIV